MWPATGMLRVRMTEEDRQTVNKMIRHKRLEFERVIQRGVIAMLNEHAERRTLDSERSQMLNLFATRTQHKKEQLNRVSNVMKDVTESAPMGIAAASNALITSANSIGNAIYDNAEEKRLETEAKERLASAQVMHYLKSSNYVSIANQVARILSYRFQFLIFRLSGGEEGYIRLAQFFIESMQAYAIEQLRAHKEEYVQALIEAAIAPPANARRYRAWPSFEPSNFRIRFDFAYRKTLKLDNEAHQIVKRCGPAVRTFLGGYGSTMDPVTCHEKQFHAYTIRGALHHAYILNTKGHVMSNDETSLRHHDPLLGDHKYPMLLLACNETTADLGTEVATSLSSVALQDQHVIALKRLVPNFFAHQANYVLNDNATKLPNLSEHDGWRYPEESREIPWYDERERVWKIRLKTMYQAAHQGDLDISIQTLNNTGELIIMRDTGHQFDADEARKQVTLAEREARLQYQHVYEQQSIESRIKAATAAKYLAISTQMYLNSLIKCGASIEDNLRSAVLSIEVAQVTLSASFDLAFLEVKRHMQLRQALAEIDEQTRRVDALKSVSYQNLAVLVDSLAKLPQMSSFSLKTISSLSEKGKTTRLKYETYMQQSAKMIELVEIITGKDDILPPGEPSFVEELHHFETLISAIYTGITSMDQSHDLMSIKQTLELHELDYKWLCAEITAVLQAQDFIIENGADVLNDAKILLNQLTDLLSQLNKTHASDHGLTAFNTGRQLKTDLLELCQRAQALRESCFNVFCNIRLKPVHTELQEKLHDELSALLARVKLYHRLGMVSLFVSKKHDQDHSKQMDTLWLRFRELYHRNLRDGAWPLTNRLRQKIDDSHSLRGHLEDQQFLQQAIDFDVDATQHLFNQAQWMISNIDFIKQDKQALHENLLTLLDESSAALLKHLDEVPSPSAEEKTVIDELLHLFLAENGSAVETKSENTLEEKLNQYAALYHALNQIVTNITTNQAVYWITEQLIKAKIIEYLQALKGNKSNSGGFSRDWSGWLIANVIQWSTHQILSHEVHGIKACHAIALHELNTMKRILAQEPETLIASRRAALKEINQAYRLIQHTKREQAELSDSVCLHRISKGVIISQGLIWAGRSNHSVAAI